MSRARNRNPSRRGCEPNRGLRSPASAPSGKSGRRRALFRLAAAVLSPLLVFGLLEGILRLAGAGYPTSFFLEARSGAQEMVNENPRFAWRFQGRARARSPSVVSFPKSKTAGTCRVFVLGESAAQGDPQPNYGLARMLGVLLRERFPGLRFELINAALTAINSHAILPIARDCASQNGDVWVIYMGNNEIVGPFGAGTIFGPKVPPLALIRGSLALRSTRTAQLLDILLGGQRQHDQDEWGGLAMFTSNKIEAEDPRLATVYAHFQRNLADMLAVGVKHGVGIVISTVAVNLRDCAPFASLHRSNLTESQRAEWQRLYQMGIEAQTAGRAADAVRHFDQAGQIDQNFAELHFRRGQCSLALGDLEAARRDVKLARERDALRFRADDRINQLIRQAASGQESRKVFLADSEVALAEQSPHGLPGHELFYEHVHLTFAGNYLLARTIAEQVARALPPDLAGQVDPRREWPSPAECARRLGWGDWSRHEGATAMLARIADLPFTMQANHAEQRRQLQEEIEQCLPGLQPAALNEAIANCRQTLLAAPGDWVLHETIARLSQKVGRLPEAIEAWRQVMRLVPQHAEARNQAGLLLIQLNQPADAVRIFEEALRVSPGDWKAINGLGQALVRQGKSEQAARLYQEALKDHPDLGPIHLSLALALMSQGRQSEADPHLRKALQSRLNTPRAMEELGRVCRARGWFSEAITNFNDALRLDPSDARVHMNLGETLSAAGRPSEALHHYAEAVRLNPNLPEAHFRLGFELGRQGRDAEAIDHFAAAVRIKPDLMEAHLNLGIALTSQRRLDDAQRHFQEVLRLSPTNATALRYIEDIRKMQSEGR